MKNKKKRENAKKNKEGEDVPAAGSGNNSPAGTPARSNTPRPNSTGTRNGGSPVIGSNSNNNNNKSKNLNGGLLPATTTSSSGQMTETEKKIRNVTKKLKQIHELKEKQAAGETLELTQIQKITAEAALLKELEALKI